LESPEDAEKDRMADLPIANISRIMKNALPDNAKIAKDAKECVQECVTEFIAFITSEGTSPSNALSVLMRGASVGEVSSGEEEDGEWGGYYICHDVPRL
jgi:hypothetical protein